MTTEFTITTKSAEATTELGRILGGLIKQNDAILLSGDLGAGKTTFVKGLAAGAGYEGVARSPSFVLVNEYHGNPNIAHCDLYRIAEAEFSELGLYEYLERGALVVEWHERATALAGLDALVLQLKYGTATNDRIIKLASTNKRGKSLQNALISEWTKARN